VSDDNAPEEGAEDEATTLEVQDSTLGAGSDFANDE